MPELPEVQTVVNDLNKKIIGRRILGVWFDWPKTIKIIAEPRRIGRRTTRKPVGVSPRQVRVSQRLFGEKIKGLRITEVKRRGKNILIYLSNESRIESNDARIRKTIFEKDSRKRIRDGFEKILLIHQKMTGHLLYGKWSIGKVKSQRSNVKSLIPGPLEEKVNDYIHLIFYLDNGMQLALSDLRKFAKVLLGTRKEIENLPELQKMGPEPLDKSFTFDKFKEQILYSDGRVRIVSLREISRRETEVRAGRVRRRAFRMQKIKQVLMDPYIIAGIGNIYSDDILWQAKVHPLTPAYKLKTYQLKSLYRAMRQILKKALRLRGTSISDFRDTAGKVGFYGDKRLVYQREDEPCGRCGVKIKRIKIGGRSAHYCPHCQKM